MSSDGSESGQSAFPSWGVKVLPILLAVGAAAVTAVRGCQQGPFGRTQIVAVGPTEEAKLGVQAFHQVLEQQGGNVLPGGPLVSAVQNIAGRLQAAAERQGVLEKLGLRPQNFEWEVRVVRSQEVNAFCLPGGKIVVYTGIIPVAENAGALAAVMGHEIGHALAHHGAERMAQEQFAQLGQTAAAESIGDMDPSRRQQVMAVLNAGAKFGVLLPYSRKHESEADHIGLLLMAGAGYDPAEATRFWKRMSEHGGKAPPAFASTHPANETRIHDLEGWTPDAIALYNASEKAPDDGRKLPRQ